MKVLIAWEIRNICASRWAVVQRVWWRSTSRGDDWQTTGLHWLEDRWWKTRRPGEWLAYWQPTSFAIVSWLRGVLLKWQGLQLNAVNDDNESTAALRVPRRGLFVRASMMARRDEFGLIGWRHFTHLIAMAGVVLMSAIYRELNADDFLIPRRWFASAQFLVTSTSSLTVNSL